MLPIEPMLFSSLQPSRLSLHSKLNHTGGSYFVKLKFGSEPPLDPYFVKIRLLPSRSPLRTEMNHPQGAIRCKIRGFPSSSPLCTKVNHPWGPYFAKLKWVTGPAPHHIYVCLHRIKTRELGLAGRPSWRENRSGGQCCPLIVCHCL